MQTLGGVWVPGSVNLSAPPTKEAGTAAGTGYGHLDPIEVDYAEAWRPPKRWETIEKMRTDPLAQACLTALTYPVLGAEMLVEPASDDPKDRELAEFIEEGLHNMTSSLQRHRVEALDCVGDGVAVFELQFEKREDKRWHLRKMALRPNKTITEWAIDETGGPLGVKQQKGKGGEVFLEIDRLLAFTHLGRGPSLLGTPALRAMYRPWLLLDRMARVAGVGYERNSMGMPWAKYIGGNPSEALRIDQALMAMHVHEKMFFRVDQDIEDWGFKGVEGELKDPVPFMEYLRRDLFLAAMAQFLALGTDGVGSLALSGDQTGFFMLAVRFIAEEIEDAYNRHLVPRWIGYNKSVPKDRLPRIQHGVIDQRKALEWAQAVAQLVQAGVTLPGEELRQTAARLLGVTIPDEPDQPAPDVQDVNDPTAPTADDEAPRSWRGVALASRLESEIKLEALGIEVDFAGMSKELDAGRDRIIARVTALQEKQARILVKAGEKIVKGGSARVNGKEVTREMLVAALVTGEVGIEEVNLADRLVPFSEEMEALEQEMWEVYDYATDVIVYELEQVGFVKPVRAGRDFDFRRPSPESRRPTPESRRPTPDSRRPTPGGRRPTPNDPSARGEPLFGGSSRMQIAGAAAVTGVLLADRMQASWGAEMARQLGAGIWDAGALLSRLVGGGRLLADQASSLTGRAMALGRLATMLLNGVEVGVYTAAMDANTCGPCRELDGKEVNVRDVRVPNPECEGGDKCRCQIIPTK